jgi:PAS domain S-box-containing protein
MNKKNIISASDDKAFKLKVLTKEKESVRRKLAVTAEKLRLKAKQLAVTAVKKESVRHKLVVTAKKKESVRHKLVVTAQGKEDVRRKLAVTAKQLAVTAKEKESIRRKLAVTAKQLAVTAKEKESIRRKLAVTAEELRLNAKQLAEAKAKDEAMLASIGDGLVATDTEGKIALMNKAFEEMLGWKEDEIQGKLFSEIVPMVDENGKHMSESGRSINIILKKRVKATITTATSYYKRRDGTFFPVVITTSPIFSENEFIGVIEVFRDITKEKDIDKAKTEFVSLASHQLRTPLTTVSWYSEMLLAGDAGELNDKQKKYLDEVYRGNQRMVVLVNDLLNVSRLELGTFVVESEPTDVIKLVQSVVNEQKTQINERRIQLLSSFEKDIPLMQVDPKLLRMVFQNLLSNAVKYTPDKGRVSINLRLIKRGESIDKQKINKDSIAFVVSDTGYGIPKNQQDKIFTKLFRADNVREKDTEGTGLGLYIVKSIIDHASGMIWFESEENKGTTFYVILPLAGMKKKEGTKTFA